VTNLFFVFAISYLFFKALDRLMGIRVASDVEREGLDQYEVAVAAYPEFNLRQLPFSSGYRPKP
jgi:Amt family ammonium transporter